MPIPPTGWGAVEILIWDCKETLERKGHEVVIINTPDMNEIVFRCNQERPDAVLIQYDVFWPVCDFINAPYVGINSHFGYLTQENRYEGFYGQILNGFLSMKKGRILASSPEIRDLYIRKGFDPSRIDLVINAVRDDLFRFDEECKLPEKSLYLAKVEPRKRQYLFQSIDSIDFVGPSIEARFDTTRSNYIPEWNKEQQYNNMTNYANLVLLSDGEAHPLVCMDAMIAGLGLVISEYCTPNLDLSLPFIDVIPEHKIHDLNYVRQIVDENRRKSIPMRKEIRQYCLDNFTWDKIVDKYYLTLPINKQM